MDLFTRSQIYPGAAYLAAKFHEGLRERAAGVTNNLAVTSNQQAVHPQSMDSLPLRGFANTQSKHTYSVPRV